MTSATQVNGRAQLGLLVADDDESVREMLGDSMRQAGFSVWLAPDGYEALDVCRTCGDAIHVALVDIQMPRLDGPKTLVALRRLAPHVRGCLMSGQWLAFSEEALQQLGADAFVHKPFAPSELVPMVQALAHASASSGVAADEVAELRRSNGELLSFASNVAHDLRSPLMAVELALAAIKPDATERVRAGSLAQARRGLEQMARLISTMLAYARADGGALLTEGRCDCEAALETAIDALRAQIDATHAVVTHDRLPVIAGDQTLFTQLLQNLLENSIKYRAGVAHVHITAETVGSAWLFSVADNGIGIPSECQPRVFDPFFRCDGPGSSQPGAGLGLATCRRIVQRHRGRIWVDSSPGQGSLFQFTFPAYGPPVVSQAPATDRGRPASTNGRDPAARIAGVFHEIDGCDDHGARNERRLYEPLE